uniref:Uncharacterized protein n=1 Tax=Rhizophora mucronata TaxID=61149 RepID=A0A2P2QB10_RHIMU
MIKSSYLHIKTAIQVTSLMPHPDLQGIPSLNWPKFPNAANSMPGRRNSKRFGAHSKQYSTAAR